MVSRTQKEVSTALEDTAMVSRAPPFLKSPIDTQIIRG